MFDYGRKYVWLYFISNSIFESSVQRLDELVSFTFRNKSNVTDKISRRNRNIVKCNATQQETSFRKEISQSRSGF
jgi:hypothetical protein